MQPVRWSRRSTERPWRYAKDDYDIILLATKANEEAEGTFGEARTHQVVGTPEEVDNLLSVTLSALCEFRRQPSLLMRRVQTVDRLRQRFPKLVDPPSMTSTRDAKSLAL